MKRTYLCVGMVLLAAGSAFADQQTLIAGQQVMIARRANKPVVIDGVRSPGEWSAAIPVHVDAVRAAEAPGLVPWQGLPNAVNPPRNQDDCSYKVYTMYDDNYLYVAVDVADNVIISDNPVLPFLDDCVEIYINGDKQPSDLDAIVWVPDWYGVLPNNEGFQLDTSVGNVRNVYPYPPGIVQVDWDSAAGLRPRGYLVEARISLDSINTIDNSWWTNTEMTPADVDGDPTESFPAGVPFEPAFRRPQPGDTIGFNVTVGDDDCGLLPGTEDYWQDSYGRTEGLAGPNPSSYLAWDGSSADWNYADESAWGTLYLAP